MLEDIASHILDITQNSIRAKAGVIRLTLREGPDGMFSFSVADDGKGMSPEQLKAAIDPFHTTRTARRVGMGLSFLKQATELCGGSFSIESTLGVGTTLFASFDRGAIDAPPLGDVAGAVMTLFLDAPDVHWLFLCEKTGEEPFELDSDDLAEAIGGLASLSQPDIALGLREMIEENMPYD
jgi:hypothetical protein